MMDSRQGREHRPPRDSAAHRPPGDAERITELQAQLDAVEHQLTITRALLLEANDRNGRQAVEFRRARQELESLLKRRSVRGALLVAAQMRQVGDRYRAIRGLAQAVAGYPRRIVRGVLRRIRDAFRQRGLRVSAEEEEQLISAVRRDDAGTTVTTGPLVSIVILNRDGREHLERCLLAVATTAYREIEVVIVDNGSTDGSPELAEQLALPFPLKVIRNRDNRSFSEANGQGVAAASGELICFLNNDVDPITEHWLGYMVETLTNRGVAAVGARLIYPRHRGVRRAGSRLADLTVQHAGVQFNRSGAIPLPVVIGAGADPLAPAVTAVVDRPALTAACLLVRRTAFDEVGGFTAEYDYGIEDVDFCLKLGAAGHRLVYDGRAALWHHESATRAADRARYRARGIHNRELFVDHWGPRIFRSAALDALTGTAHLSADPFHVAIAVTSNDATAGFGDWFTGHELGDALEGLGWRVTYLERAEDGWYQPDASVEAVIVLLDALDIRRLPRHVVTMAWIRNWAERWLDQPWFDEYDIVFGSSQRIVELVRERSAKVATLLPLATNPARFQPSEPDPGRSCDVLFTGSYWGQPRAVMEALPALAARGLDVRVHGRGWAAIPAMARLDRGYLAYDELPSAYASARVVVDDAASSTRSVASVNSRVFDALAAGAVVVSDGEAGVTALFDSDFPTWSDSASLVTLVETILRDPAAAAAKATGYRSRVVAEDTYEHRARAVRDALTAWTSATRYGIRIGAPSWDVIERWGDYYFARALQRALERRGHPTRVHLLPDWASAVAARDDVTVHLFGLKEAPTRRGQVNLLWQISHPDLASPTLYNRYDRVFVASDAFAERMGAVATVPVRSLHQATSPDRFRPTPGGPPHELLFVANSRNVRRRIIDDLADTPHDLAVYGRGWTSAFIDTRFVRGQFIPNAELAAYYSSASIVLNDHWDDMRAEGFLSNRLYDALACGAFVISDHVAGIEAEFDGAVVSYRAPDELEPLISRYLADPAERRRLAERGREIVIRRHTFDVRAGVLVDAAAEILAERTAAFPTSGSTVASIR